MKDFTDIGELGAREKEIRGRKNRLMSELAAIDKEYEAVCKELDRAGKLLWQNGRRNADSKPRKRRKISLRRKKTASANGGRGPKPRLNEQDRQVLRLFDGKQKYGLGQATVVYFGEDTPLNRRRTYNRIDHLKKRGEKYDFLSQSKKTGRWEVDWDEVKKLT